MKLKEKLKSRKFWMAILAAALPFINQAVAGGHVPPEQMITAGAGIVSYILGQSYVDGKK